MVVSENLDNFIAINLESNISCEIICRKIQGLVNKYQKSGKVKDSILYISIKTPTDSHIIHKPLGIPCKDCENNS
jgi:hypothetical protein